MNFFFDLFFEFKKNGKNRDVERSRPYATGCDLTRRVATPDCTIGSTSLGNKKSSKKIRKKKLSKKIRKKKSIEKILCKIKKIYYQFDIIANNCD